MQRVKLAASNAHNEHSIAHSCILVSLILILLHSVFIVVAFVASHESQLKINRKVLIGRLVHIQWQKNQLLDMLFLLCKACSSMYQCSHSLLLFAFYLCRRLLCVPFYSFFPRFCFICFTFFLFTLPFSLWLTEIHSSK